MITAMYSSKTNTFGTTVITTTIGRGTATREMGRWPQYCLSPRREMGDGWRYREAGGGRSPRNPKGDGRFYKNWSVSQWDMGDSDPLSPLYRCS